jgi:ribosomal RNA assembly protein
MKILPYDENSKAIKSKTKLGELLNVKISLKKNELTIEGTPEEEYTAEKVLEALMFGFPITVALMIKDEDFSFEILNIKDYTTRKDLERIRARIIGTEGKTFRTLNQLTECYFEIKGNEIGIIGDAEYIKNAHEAVISIIHGSKQANVYSFLEKHHIQPILDLGLKKSKGKYVKKAKKIA